MIIITEIRKMTNQEIEHIYNLQTKFYKTQKTKSFCFRLDVLQKLKQVLTDKNNFSSLIESLKQDLGLFEFDNIDSEYEFCLSELDYFLNNLHTLVIPKKVKNNMSTMFYKTYKIYEPLGLTYIMSSYNLPLRFTLVPMIESIAAGNVTIIRISDSLVNFKKSFSDIINSNFDREYLFVASLTKEESNFLLNKKFDHIVYSGSQSVAKKIMHFASLNLSKFTFLLSDKSPCVLLEDADIDIACEKIVKGKFVFSGQTSVSVDNLYVKNSQLELVKTKLKEHIFKLFDIKNNDLSKYSKVVNQKHFDRLKNYFLQGKPYIGGNLDINELRLQQGIISDVNFKSKLDIDEIFGPILPIYTYKSFSDLLAKLDVRMESKPIAFYVFGKNMKNIDNLLDRYSFGSACVNDTLIQLNNNNLPYNGVKNSGINSINGIYGFETFSHIKSVTIAPNKVNKLRFPPFSNDIKEIDRIVKFFYKI